MTIKLQHQKKACATALLVMLSGSTAFAATVGIDDFDQTTQVLSFNPPEGGPIVSAGSNDFSEANAPEAIGGFRDLFIQTDGDIAFNDSGEAAVVSTNGNVQIANSVNSSINTAITWDGADNLASVNTSGLGGVDLIDGTNTGLLLDIDFADLGVDLAFNIWDTAGNTATVSRNFANQVRNEQVFFDYSDLIGDSVDLTSVGAIQLLASGPLAYDINFNFLQSVNPNPPTVVSAPATIALVGLGIFGVSMTARKRKT
ncbi:MAG TPA: hypothetical protein ENJ32_04600 [Crenotrichaceae bacterium]|nr:hypothetical protein [Crenotrichaceae bacterium]